MALLLLTDPNEISCPAGTLDTSTGEFKQLSQSACWNGTARGVGRQGNWLVIGIQGSGLGCLCFMYYDRGSFIQGDCVSLTGVSDIHDVKWHKSDIFVVSAANDRIYSFDISTIGLRLVSSFHDEEKDTVHRNSICRWKGTWWVSRFGEKPEEGWRPAYKGEIHRLFDRKLSKSKIEKAYDVSFNTDFIAQPHSLTVVQDLLVVLESGSRWIKGALSTVNLCQLPWGYARGMAYDKENELVYVAVSSPRSISKHQGGVVLPYNDQEPCGVFKVCVETWKVLQFYPIPDQQMTEIYEVVLLEP